MFRVQPSAKRLQRPGAAFARRSRSTTRRCGTWPLHKRSMSLKAVGRPAKSLQADPRLGGKIVEIGLDGAEYHRGTIKAIDPNDSVAMDFHMGMPPEQASLVEVVFVSVSEDRTRVTLTQSNWKGSATWPKCCKHTTGRVGTSSSRKRTAERAAVENVRPRARHPRTQQDRVPFPILQSGEARVRVAAGRRYAIARRCHVGRSGRKVGRTTRSTPYTMAHDQSESWRWQGIRR
jgi:hypothetical protein